MRKTLLILAAFAFCTMSWAQVQNNVIRYTASAQLMETTSAGDAGLHTNAFKNGDNYMDIVSHVFQDGVGTITLGNTLTAIDGAAFKNSAITSISIPTTVTMLIGDVFLGCPNLTDLSFENNDQLKTIGAYVFSGSSIKSIVLPASLKEIYNYAFRYCRNLAEIQCLATKPPKCEEFMGEVFYYTPKDIPVYVPESSIDDYKEANGWKAFSNIQKLQNEIRYTAESKIQLDASAFNTSIVSHEFSDGTGVITFLSNVKTIGDNAFKDCKLTSLTLPFTVTTIGQNVFDGCPNLESFVLGDGNTKYYSIDKNMTSVTIMDGVTQIGTDAFKNFSNLKSVVCLPTSVPTMKSGVFEGCSSIATVYVPAESLTAYKEADGWASFSGKIKGFNGTCGETVVWAFDEGTNTLTIAGTDEMAGSDGQQPWNKSNINSVIIEDGVTSIGNNAFEGCSSLTSVTCLATTPPDMGSDVFKDCAAGLAIYVPIGCAAEYQGKQNWDGYSTKICNGSCGDGVVWALTGTSSNYTLTISYTGSGTGAMTDYDMENEIKYPAPWYDYRTGIVQVIIGDDVTSVGDDAFYGCNSLPVEGYCRYAGTYLIGVTDDTQSTYTVKDGTRFIGNKAFYECMYLTSVSIPNTVTSIGGRAFFSCTSLESVAIPNSVTSIGNSAFNFCTSLTAVTIPAAVTSIGSSAFCDCSKLELVTCLAATRAPELYPNVFLNCASDLIIYVPEGTLEKTYQTADGWKDLAELTDELPTTVTLNTAGFATFSAAQNISVKTADVKAYKAVVSDSNIALTELDGYIPAGTGVLLYGTANTSVSFYAIPSGTAATNLADNSLVATTQADGTLVDKSGVTGTVWVLGDSNQFLHYTGPSFIDNRAYINYELPQPQSAPMRLVFTDGGTTLVEDVITPEQKTVKRIENGNIVIVRNGRKYNLVGQEIK